MNKNILPVFLLLAVFLFSCTEGIDFSDEYEKKVTVNLILEDKDTQELSLCFNAEPGTYRYTSIKDADVRLFEDGTEVGKFIYQSWRNWTLDYRPKAGHTYSLSVKVPEYEEITAETTMPRNVKVGIQRDRSWDTVTHKITDYRKYFLQKSASDPYWIFVMRRHTLYDILDQKNLEIEPEDRLENSIGSDHIALDNFNVEDFLMFTDVAGPAGQSLSHPGYLRIEKTDDSLEYPLIFFIEASLVNSIVVFRAASDEYDKYMKSSLIKAYAYQAEDDITSYFEENTVYSNIEGGLGIFAACSDTLIARSSHIDRHWAEQ